MLKKHNLCDRGRAAALFSGQRAAALVFTQRATTLFFLFISIVAFPTGRAFAQATEIVGNQLRIVTNVQTGTSYTVTPSDCGKLLSLSNAANIVVTIPPAGSGGLVNGCWIDIQNTGTSTSTFTSGSSMVDGGSGFALAPSQGLRLVSTGVAYYTQRGQGSGSSGGGALSIQSGGTSLGPAATLNIVGGTGVSCVPQVTAGVMTFQCNADTSYLVSKTNLQGSANPQICTSSSASGTAYTAGCASPLTAYAAKQTLYWFADVASTSATPTLNIDTLGPHTMTRLDGTSLAAGDIKASTLYRIWYDGANFRVVEAGLNSGSGTGATTSRGLFSSRGACAAGQTGNTFYSTDIAHFSQCDGVSWADYFQGQPVSLPAATSFITLNGTGATVATNGISTISAPAAAATDIVGQEIPVPSGTWTVVAWLRAEDQGVANAPSAARVLYVRDGTGKMVGLYSQSAAGGNQLQWVHISSASGAVTGVQTAAQTSYFIPFLRIRYDGTNLTYSGCTTYNAATSAGAAGYGGGNCETFSSESASAYLGALAAVGWGLDAHSGGSDVNAVTALDWQVTN